MLKCVIASSIDTSTVRPWPVRPALDERAHHTVGGIEAGQRIGDGRADDARVLRVHEQFEEAARGLRHGVVGGAIRSRPVAAESR